MNYSFGVEVFDDQIDTLWLSFSNKGASTTASLPECDNHTAIGRFIAPSPPIFSILLPVGWTYVSAKMGSINFNVARQFQVCSFIF